MYRVKYKDIEDNFDTLDQAMQYAKVLNEVVEIITPSYTVVGKFGVDSVVEGKCPDGQNYEWRKRR